MRLQFLLAALVGLAATAGSAQAAIKFETINYKQGWLVYDDATSAKRPGIIVFPGVVGPVGPGQGCCRASGQIGLCQIRCRVGHAPSLVLRAVEDRRQAIGMRSFALPGATRSGEGLSERKNVAGDQEVIILGAHRMPIHAVGRDGDFRHQIGARKRDALLRKTTQRDATDHAILVADLSSSRNWRNSAASASVPTVGRAQREIPPPAPARCLSTPWPKYPPHDVDRGALA